MKILIKYFNIFIWLLGDKKFKSILSKTTSAPFDVIVIVSFGFESWFKNKLFKPMKLPLSYIISFLSFSQHEPS